MNIGLLSSRNSSLLAFSNIENKLIASNTQNTLVLRCIIFLWFTYFLKDLCQLKEHMHPKKFKVAQPQHYWHLRPDKSCHGHCSWHCRIFSGMPGLLDAYSTPALSYDKLSLDIAKMALKVQGGKIIASWVLTTVLYLMEFNRGCISLLRLQ